MHKTIAIEQTVKTAVEPTPHVLQVAAMFGLGVDETRAIAVVPRCEIPLPHFNGRSGIVFVTGPSGSGKSTILKLIAEAIGRAAADSHCWLVRFDQLPELPDAPLVDVLGGRSLPLERVLMWLSLAGLNEAFVMLRRPCELSDGQRYRLRLAQVMAMLNESPAASAVVIADEFGSTLDRVTAMTIARNLKRWLAKHAPMPVSFVCATTHDDLLEALDPDVLVWKGLGDELEVAAR